MRKVTIQLTDTQISMVLGCLYETRPTIDVSELELWSETNAIFEDAENEYYENDPNAQRVFG